MPVIKLTQMTVQVSLYTALTIGTNFYCETARFYKRDVHDIDDWSGRALFVGRCWDA